MNRLFLRKSVQDCENDILERGGLRRSLGKWHLTALGVGATIGAGIFATTGTAIVGDAIRLGAGPAIVLAWAGKYRWAETFSWRRPAAAAMVGATLLGIGLVPWMQLVALLQ